MHIRFLSLTLLTAFCLLATPVLAADAVFPPGSHFGLVPPPGFEASATGRGFEDKQNRSIILLLEMPPQAYAEVEKAMTADTLRKQGVAVAFRESISLKDGKGTLIAGRQVVDGVAVRKWILLGSTSKATALITAMVPEDAKNIHSDAALRTALASLEMRASVPVEEMLSLLPYKLNDLAGMRPFRVEGTTVFMTDGPKDTLDGAEQPAMAITAAPGGPAEQPQRENFARTLFTGFSGYKEMRVISADIIRLGGVQTHQLLAEAKDAKTDADVKIVQWVRFGNGAYIRTVGLARTEIWPELFTRFRAVRDGIGGRS
jgi:hypothetical protein